MDRIKKTSLLVALFMLSLSLSAQENVTKFLNIPIDGSKSEMIKKLKSKGFVVDADSKELLRGEFNGKDVYLNVVTNKDKVYRILVFDANPISESDIKIRFNNLCLQFEENERYMSADLDSINYTIPENEDISYELLVNNKRYEAFYYQVPPGFNLEEEVESYLFSKRTKDEILSLTDEEKEDFLHESAFYLADTLEELSKKLVWFTIVQVENEYSIAMFYDNKYNEADGEDL